MKMKAVILLVVAVSCGLVAMLGVQQVLSGNKSDKVEMGKVLVATAEIVPGTPLNEENTIFKELPLESIPEGAVTDPTEVTDKTLKSTAVPGEFIMAVKLWKDLGASGEIPKGMRVVTTSVNLTKTHSGLIRPGDRVDILLSYKVRSADRGMMDKTMTILEYIEVFATDALMASQDHGDTTEINAKNLSFLVTPKQAHILKLAESKGDLNLSLRNKQDDEHVDIAPIDDLYFEDKVGSLFGKENKEEDGNPRLMFQGGSVRLAIAGEMSEPPAATAEPEVKDIPMWKVVIYAGEDVLEQEVPLPLDDNGMTEEEAARAEEEAAFAEREAQLAEREAELNAREAEMNKRGAAVDVPVHKNDATKTETIETTAAPESTEAVKRPATVKTDKKLKTEKNGNAWSGTVKRFLTGA